MKFCKPPLTISKLRRRWEQRGLSIPEPAEAEQYLLFINDYRLLIQGRWAFLMTGKKGSSGSCVSETRSRYLPVNFRILRSFLFEQVSE